MDLTYTFRSALNIGILEYARFLPGFPTKNILPAGGHYSPIPYCIKMILWIAKCFFLPDEVNQRSDGSNRNPDLISNTQGKIIGGDDPRAGHQQCAGREQQRAVKIRDQVLYVAM